jgi:YfiH family protein
MNSLKYYQIKLAHGFLGKNIDQSTYKYVNKPGSNISKEVIINNRKLALKKLDLDIDNLCILKQIHSDKVVIVDDFFDFGFEPEADSLVTNQPNIPLGVITADCVPILLADQQNNVIAAIHAGWRGARSDLITNTIDAMKKLGAKSENIVGAIGPCIFQESYEVDQGFFANFMDESKDNNRFFINSPNEHHYMFDLPGYTYYKLFKYINKIDNMAIDTFVNEGRFFSYRRSCVKKTLYQGSNIAIISINFQQNSL